MKLMRSNTQGGQLKYPQIPTWVKCDVKSRCSTHEYSPDEGLFYPLRNGNERRLCSLQPYGARLHVFDRSTFAFSCIKQLASKT